MHEKSAPLTDALFSILQSGGAGLFRPLIDAAVGFGAYKQKAGFFQDSSGRAVFVFGLAGDDGPRSGGAQPFQAPDGCGVRRLCRIAVALVGFADFKTDFDAFQLLASVEF